MPFWKYYLLPETVNEALQALAEAPGPARLIAGGTDLLLDLQQGRHPPVDTLVDVTSIPELKSLEVREERLFIGAAVPVNKIVSSSLVKEHAQALVEACDLIGGPQVRNTATLGGNVAHALPAADGTIALLALNAQAEVARVEERCTMPVSDLFLGPGRSKLNPKRELLVGFYLPLRKEYEASAFKRVMRPQGVALPILNMAAWIRRSGEGGNPEEVADLRLAVGPAGPTPRRAIAAERFLRGKTFDRSLFLPSLEVLLSESHFRTSPHRASADYRRHLTGVLLESALTTAWDRTCQRLPIE
jgi:carbon-monoxide dehydrogenase medium subunit